MTVIDVVAAGAYFVPSIRKMDRSGDQSRVTVLDVTRYTILMFTRVKRLFQDFITEILMSALSVGFLSWYDLPC
jgi:hypothetical protein